MADCIVIRDHDNNCQSVLEDLPKEFGDVMEYLPRAQKIIDNLPGKR